MVAHGPTPTGRLKKLPAAPSLLSSGTHEITAHPSVLSVRSSFVILEFHHEMNDSSHMNDDGLTKPPRDAVVAAIEPALKVGAACGKHLLSFF